MLMLTLAGTQAVIARYGAWEVDDAPPVSVELLELAGSSSLGSSSTGDGGSSSSSGTAASRQGSTIQVSNSVRRPACLVERAAHWALWHSWPCRLPRA